MMDLWSTCLNLLTLSINKSITVLLPRQPSDFITRQIIVHSLPSITSLASWLANFIILQRSMCNRLQFFNDRVLTCLPVNFTLKRVLPAVSINTQPTQSYSWNSAFQSGSLSPSCTGCLWRRPFPFQIDLRRWLYCRLYFERSIKAVWDKIWPTSNILGSQRDSVFGALFASLAPPLATKGLPTALLMIKLVAVTNSLVSSV